MPYRLLLCLIVLPILSFAEETSSKQQQKKTKQTEFCLIRDLLQPLGLPLVSSYHSVRENAFLNTRTDTSSTLEKIGNFFLTPSRCFFGGKDVKLPDQSCAPSCNYDHFLAPKMLLSLAVLPFSELLGSAFKGLAFLSEETRARHLAIESILHPSSVISKLPSYVEQGIASFYSDEWIPCKELKRPSVVSEKHQIELEALKAVTHALQAKNIPHWIDCGTCLGAYRYGGIIPWDVDVDVSILSPDHENVKCILSQLDPEKYEIQDWSSYSHPNTFLKLYIKETKTLIDIYHYMIDPEKKTLTYFYAYKDTPIPYDWKKTDLPLTKPVPYEAVFPLKKANFDGLTVWAPHDVETFLKSKYGENLDPTMIWDEAEQLYKKVEDHPYWKQA